MAVFDYGWAATYYVDYAGGSDSNNGISAVTAFKHSPGDSNCTGTCAATSLSPGDKVILKGGVVYNSSTGDYKGTIEVNWSGSGDADSGRIIYDGDSGTYVPRWGSGTGKAVIDGNGTQDYLFRFPSAKSYVTINNFELRNGYEATNRGRLIMAANSSTYINVSNCTIHDAGSSDLATISGIGIYTYGSYWKIRNNRFYDCYGDAIDMGSGASHNQIYNNEFTDKAIWGVRIWSGTATVTDNSIYNNDFHDIYYYDGKGPHTDFLFLAILGTGNLTNTRIYNNRFFNTAAFSDRGGTAMLFIQTYYAQGTGGQLNDTYIFNNVFFNPHSYYAINISAEGGNLYLYNNSFATPITGSAAINATTRYTNGINGFYVKNNSFQSVGAAACNINALYKNIQMDYNNYSNGGTYKYSVVYGGLYYDLSSWKGFGHDTHSTSSDPLHMNISPAAFDLRPQAASPLRNKGESLCCTFTADLNGVCRPQGGAWDIGAYEYNEGSACACLCNGINVSSTTISAPSAPVVGTVPSDTSNISNNTTSTVSPILSRSALVRQNIIKRIKR